MPEWGTQQGCPGRGPAQEKREVTMGWGVIRWRTETRLEDEIWIQFWVRAPEKGLAEDSRSLFRRQCLV